MQRTITTLLLISVLLAPLGACTREVPDLKSPCVGADSSPCDRRPVNQQFG